jgi:membrane associated rhomboid family serine protease
MIPLRDSHPSYSRPVVTIALIALNALIFLYTVAMEPQFRNVFVGYYGMVPAQFQVRDLFTSMFLHGGWMHLIGNMWFLWIYGDNVEDALGSWRYLAFYLLCGLAAGTTHLATNLDSRVPTIGASGAIAGVMGAYLIKFPHARILTLVPLFVFITTVELPAWLILIYWFVIQLFSGVGSLATQDISQGGIAWWAHAGGFIAGMALVRAMARKRSHNYYRVRW